MKLKQKTNIIWYNLRLNFNCRLSKSMKKKLTRKFSSIAPKKKKNFHRPMGNQNGDKLFKLLNRLCMKSNKKKENSLKCFVSFYLHSTKLNCEKRPSFPFTHKFFIYLWRRVS